MQSTLGCLPSPTTSWGSERAVCDDTDTADIMPSVRSEEHRVSSG